MAWIYLIIAGIIEIAWATGMKYTDGFTKLWPSIFVVALMLPGFYVLGVATKTIPIGTAYAVWTGIGAAGVAIMGMWLFNEPVTLVRILCITGIITCVVVLKLTSEVS